MCWKCDLLAPQCEFVTSKDIEKVLFTVSPRRKRYFRAPVDIIDCEASLSGPESPCASEPTEATHGRAYRPNRTSSSGMNPPLPRVCIKLVHWCALCPNTSIASYVRCTGLPAIKEPRQTAQKWFAPGKVEPNDTEILFFALLICASDISAGDLHKWACSVSSLEEEARRLRHEWHAEQWVFEPMRIAYTNTIWSHERLDEIGIAIEQWPGPGQRDSLRWSPLLNHLRAKAKAVPRTPKHTAPPRWRSCSIVEVAALIKAHGPALRLALRLDARRRRR